LEIFAFRRFFSEPIGAISICRFRSAEGQHLKPNRDRTPVTSSEGKLIGTLGNSFRAGEGVCL